MTIYDVKFRFQKQRIKVNKWPQEYRRMTGRERNGISRALSHLHKGNGRPSDHRTNNKIQGDRLHNNLLIKLIKLVKLSILYFIIGILYQYVSGV
jgi:hypothetical protein